MTVVVVDLFEVVDIDNGQPLLRHVVHDFQPAQLGRCGRRIAHELFFKRLAIEQARQGIALAVVEQALIILIDLKHAHDHVALAAGERSGLGDFEAGVGLFVDPHRQPERVARNARAHGAQAMGFDALGELGHVLERATCGVGGGIAFG